MTFIQLKSGAFVDCTGRRPIIGDITLDDIFTGLHHQHRFGGHRFGLTVLEHSIHVYVTLKTLGYSDAICASGLMHDAAEAITGDIPGPLKKIIPGYQEIEQDLQAQIEQKVGVPQLSETARAVVKAADIACMIAELRAEGPELDLKWLHWIETHKPPEPFAIAEKLLPRLIGQSFDPVVIFNELQRKVN